MKTLYTLLVAISIMTSNTLQAQNNNYNTLWKEVEQFEIKDLPKSALSVVTTIESKAKAENNQVQLIKTLLFKSKFALILEEDAQLKVVNDFKAMIAQTQGANKNVLENMLAKLYWDYFNANRYKFYNRTKTEDKVDVTDFRTWDLETLFAEITTYYEASLSNEKQLQKKTTNDFEAILTTYKEAKDLRPTLYDFLAHNALAFYKTTENSINKPTYSFEAIDPELLSDYPKFKGLLLASKDTISLELKALQLYQNLLSCHSDNKNEIPLAAIDAERLLFVKNNGTMTNRDALFLEALKSGKAKMKDAYAKAIYDIEIAQHTYQQGQKYNNEESTDKEKYRWNFKEALTIAEQLIKQFPESHVASRAGALKQNITQQSLQMQLESYLPINTDSRMLVTYKNVKDVQLSVYKISERENEALNKIYDKDEKRNYIERLPLVKKWTEELRDDGDYRTHSTELFLLGVPQGRYLVLANPTETNNNRFFEFTTLQYTDLAIVQSQDENATIFQVVNRNNGSPIGNAKVTVTERRRNNSSKKYTTDGKGQVKVPLNNDNYHNYNIAVQYENDEASFGNLYANRRYENSPEKYNSFLFTDRSIYRPGQTVYFKGIVVNIEENKSQIIPNERLTVYMYDANGDDAGEMELVTNEYGTVTGEFIIPTGRLTGSYYLELESEGNKNFSNIHYFKVEEYKRPKFETNFKAITETYRVNDEITVTGEAMSFSGSNITNAQVSYKVTRKVQYPRWYYWGRTQNYKEGQEITFGETTTNDKGEYTIDFKAIPDRSVDKKGQPVFQYEVTADVTDINGETQSTTTIVRVGYHALTINLQLDSRIDTQNKKEDLKLNTNNLNGERVPAKVTLKLMKLKAPKRVTRPRPWGAPDYQAITEKEFNTLFPYDAYEDANNIAQWEEGETVFTKTVTTSVADEDISVPFGNLPAGRRGIKKWASGAYVLIATTKDKFGQEVQSKSYTTLFNENDATPADNKLFDITLDKDSYAPGDKATVTLKTNAAMTVTVSIDKDGKLVDTQIITLDKNSKKIQVPVTAKDIGGFGVHYSFTVFNSYQGGTLRANVPAPSTALTIETKTFRDKLEPGVPETWSFKVKGPDGEKVSAELLASMYDVSLDQFTPHQWRFNPQPSITYSTLSSPNGNNSFGSRSIYLRYPNNYNYANNTQNFDQFNWFGLRLSGQQWQYNQYKNSLRQQVKERYSAAVKEGYIRGTIVDNDGLPLPGVNVIVKGTTRGTQTDFNGNFEIQADKGEELVFSYVGFRDKTLSLKKNNLLTINLYEDNETLEEVIVTGYGIKKERRALSSAVSSIESNDAGFDQFNAEGEISNQLQGKAAGVEITQDSTEISTTDFTKVKIRTNLQETAFFFPQLKTDANGDISFNFKTPEALTRWKLQLLAHTKDLDTKVASFEAVTQKELMVVPNAPRFLREGDEIIISSKISNLSDKDLSGKVILQLNDAITNEDIDVALANDNATQDFSVAKKNNTQISWRLKIPSTVQAVTYKVIAQTGDFSDGEQNTLPVLSNRMLVTETLPMWVRSNQTKIFTLDRLRDNTSTTLKHHKLTLEVTSNPAWYAVQALPYLMEYPYECNEQTFSRYYANSLASHIANSNPRIQAVFKQWENSDALLSNLEKNQDLKSLLIQETPWVREVQSEAEQKKRIALLFDLSLMQRKQDEAISKLKQNQMGSGAWPWFNGGRENRYITQHIMAGFGHLRALGVLENEGENTMIKKAVAYLDREFVEEYERLSRYSQKPDYTKDHLSRMQTQYIYMRSFFPELKKSKEVEKLTNYYLGQMEQYWTSRNLYSKGMIALVLHRNNKTAAAQKITASLKENSITSEELGMYWNSNTPSWYWYQAPVETQALMIEVFSEIHNDITTVDNLKIWLLKNKQTNQWSTTKATTEAVYALLLQGTDWLSVTDAVEVTVGNTVIDASTLDDVKVEAGTGYFKTSWNTSEIEETMATVTMKKKGEGIAWGGVYWQYFEDLDKITSAETPLQLKKKLFLKKNTATGEEISEITEATALSVGDLVRVRIELRSDRDMDFLHMKDMRAAGLEPIDILSTYKYQDGLGYYQATKDASTNFFFDTLRKGIYVFEYDLRVNNAGTFSNGITTIQSMYAPEFSSHSEGVLINVEK